MSLHSSANQLGLRDNGWKMYHDISVSYQSISIIIVFIYPFEISCCIEKIHTALHLRQTALSFGSTFSQP